MLTYEQRADLCENLTAKKLFTIMAMKQTNLSLSVDVSNKNDLLALADLIGPDICILKTHIDILEDFNPEVPAALNALAKKHNFLIFEDRKFADIGNTVRLQYEKGIYQIAKWAKITNAHTLPGPSIIKGLKQVGLPLGNGLLLLAEMSSQGALMSKDYIKATLNMAIEHKDFVIGFITQHQLCKEPTFINMAPGIQIDANGDQLGQQYITPWQAIYNNEVDIIIVGRGIYMSDEPLNKAKLYRDKGWQAYIKRLTKTKD